MIPRLKILIFGMALTAVVTVDAATFDLGGKLRPASATVEKRNGRLNVSCRFTALKALRGDPGRSAAYNERHARSLCMKALMLYLGIPGNAEMNVSGLTSARPPRDNGTTVEYYFTVPESGISTGASVRIADRAAAVAPQSATAATNAVAAPRKEHGSLRTKASLRVARYQADRERGAVASSQTFSAKDFPDQKSFDDFCIARFRDLADNSEKAFTGIRRRFEAHLKRMRGNGE